MNAMGHSQQMRRALKCIDVRFAPKATVSHSTAIARRRSASFNRAKILSKAAAYQKVPIGAALSFAFPEADAVRRSDAIEIGGGARVAARGVFQAVVHQPNLIEA